MGRTLAEKLANLPEERQAKIEARTAELVNEQMSLQQLRKAQKLTQQRLADRLSIKQDGVSRLEKRTDMLLSTLAEVVKALGGELQMVVKFPDRPPVVLQDLNALRDPGELENKTRPSGKRSTGSGKPRRKRDRQPQPGIR